MKAQGVDEVVIYFIDNNMKEELTFYFAHDFFREFKLKDGRSKPDYAWDRKNHEALTILSKAGCRHEKVQPEINFLDSPTW